jgi:hypothetical protein
MILIPFTYHDVFSKLRDADITHYHAILDPSTSNRLSPSTERLHDYISAAAQLRPAHPPQSGCPSYPSRNDRPTGIPTHELCLDRFGFRGHEAPW